MGARPFLAPSQNILTKGEKWNNSSCSDAIDLKFGTIVEGMFTDVFAKFRGDRSSTNEDILFLAPSQNN